MNKSKKKNFGSFISNLPVIDKVILWSKKTALPGFDHVPIYDVLSFVLKEAKRDSIVTRAESIAFNIFLSIFPFIIFLLPIISRTPLVENFLNVSRKSLHGMIPSSAENYIFDMIGSIQVEGQTGWLSFGFFLAIFFASNGMSTLMTGFDKSYNTTFRSRNYVEKRVLAILLTLLLTVLFMASVVMIVLGERLIEFILIRFDLEISLKYPFYFLRWLTILLLFYSIITSIYRYGPSMYRKIKFFSPGASLATLFSILSSVAFSYFVNTFDRYNKIYGSVGALIVILLWLEINAFILLVGFELNASIAVNRDLRNAPLQKD